MTVINIRKMEEKDIEAAASVHAKAFVRQRRSLEWVQCNFRAYPRMRHYVAEINGTITGMAYWTENSGFRDEVALELDQIAVDPEYQGRGIGTKLIEESLLMANEEIEASGARIRHLTVNTRTDNEAQRIYKKTMGVEVEFVIKGLFSGDEAFMIASDVKIGRKE